MHSLLLVPIFYHCSVFAFGIVAPWSSYLYLLCGDTQFGESHYAALFLMNKIATYTLSQCDIVKTYMLQIVNYTELNVDWHARLNVHINFCIVLSYLWWIIDSYYGDVGWYNNDWFAILSLDDHLLIILSAEVSYGWIWLFILTWRRICLYSQQILSVSVYM